MNALYDACTEYENGYDSEYGGIYDENFVVYDDFDEEGQDDSDWDFDGDFGDDDDEEDVDVILEEVPFIYCPSRDEAAEA